MASAADNFLFQIGLLFLAGIVASKLAEWIRVPDIVLYLLAGIALGPPVLGWFKVPGDSLLSTLILTFGAAFMLYEGGREVDLAILRQVWRTVALLSTTGVLITALPVALAAAWLLHVPFLAAFLLAAVLAPTDPATIIPIFQRIRLIPRLSQTAQSESAFNDATGSVLVATLVAVLAAGAAAGGGGGAAVAGSLSAGTIAWHFIWLLGGGLLVGVAVGLLASSLIAEGGRLPRIFGQHETGSVMSVIIIIAAYLIAEGLGASGFMAVFAGGVMNGNKAVFGLATPEEHEHLHRQFFSVNGMIMRMLIFILLGSHVDFGLLARYVWPLAGIMAVFLFVGRPLTVLLSAGVDRAVAWTRPELTFLMWVRETGVIPAALAGLLIAQGVAHAQLINAAVFAAILVTVLLQASTTPWVARRLGVLAPAAAAGGSRQQGSGGEAH